ncbi:hypothetical protein [Gaetbulibacter aestuarii]|uniref:hypothetical protein n=1 Tax=Gaetbulibacter aestuarii TaxID=1502358 RepID=UPI0037571A99
MIALLIFAGCQTEPLSSESGLTSADAKFQKSNLRFDWSCTTTASTVDLYAGQHILVGNVTVKEDGSDYKITYNITNSGYCLKATHLSVENSPNGFPITNSGNPKVGHFEYSEAHDCLSSYTYTVPMDEGDYIAAHAVVTCTTGGVETLYATLPATANFCITTGRKIDGAKSYIKVDVTDGPLSGSYWGWCADESLGFDNVGVPQGDSLCFNDNSFTVYTLNDESHISSIIANVDHIDSALWLINNLDALLGEGYLYGNIQWALWKLLNNQECNSCNYNLKLPSGDITIAGMEVYNKAITQGDGFVPACGDQTIAILDNGVSQPIIIPIAIPCDNGDCEETAWADGCDFPGNQWATYFHYGTEN